MTDTKHILPAEDPAYADERRTATQDGAIWPLLRNQMCSPRAITERLIEDIRALCPDKSAMEVRAYDLINLGWKQTQIEKLGALACRIIEQAEAEILKRAEIDAGDAA